MKRSTIAVITIGAVLLVLGGSLIATWQTNNKNQSSAKPTPSPSPSASQQATVTTPTANTVTMEYGSAGFVPTSTTVKSGGTITFTNTSNSVAQIDSNPHPEHTDNTELNVGEIAPGQSKTVTLSRIGTWLIHNHRNALHQATIVVQ